MIGNSRRFGSAPNFLLLFALLCADPQTSALASPYIEAGTGLGQFTRGDAIAEQSLGTLGWGFIGSMNLYFPVTSLKNAIHLDLGLQNRIQFVSGSDASPMIFTPNLSLRVEFWRFFVGAAYAPKVLVDMQPKQGAWSYLFEGGLIWRVVPEFQICATGALEYGRSAGGAASPVGGTEFGLKFRFPLDPKEYGSSSGVDFDGYRYPFGIMR